MRVLLGVFIVIFAASLFLVNFSLGVFDSFGIPFFLQDSFLSETEVTPRVSKQSEEGNANLAVQEIEKIVEAPPPLKVVQKKSQSELIAKEVFIATNVHRGIHGISFLTENAVLDTIAQAKLEDMFELEYFEHESPTGILFTDLARQYGYAYLSMAENLAFGNYESEEALVQAWMDSPGHRKNILSEAYKEIGIAVGKGFFEGDEVWMAVQTFGVPLAACPAPSESRKVEIELKKSEIEALQGMINAKKAEIDGMDSTQGSAYSQSVHEFNELVERYNQLVFETQNLVKEYNDQVEIFNQCVENLT